MPNGTIKARKIVWTPKESPIIPASVGPVIEPKALPKEKKTRYLTFFSINISNFCKIDQVIRPVPTPFIKEATASAIESVPIPKRRSEKIVVM